MQSRAEIQEAVRNALSQLALSLVPDTYEIFGTWNLDGRDWDDQCRAASHAFDEAYEVAAQFFGERAPRLIAGDKRVPDWLKHARESALWIRDDREYVMYVVDDDPFIIWIYGFVVEDRHHRLAREISEEDFATSIYHLPISEKVALLDRDGTDSETLFWLFEYARAYPSAAIHDAIHRNRHRRFGDHSPEWVLTALSSIRDDIALFGDRFPQP